MGKGRRYDQEYKDMIVELFKSGMTVTEERLNNIDFSVPYTTSSQVIIVRNNDAQGQGFNLIEKFKTA